MVEPSEQLKKKKSLIGNEIEQRKAKQGMQEEIRQREKKKSVVFEINQIQDQRIKKSEVLKEIEDAAQKISRR